MKLFLLILGTAFALSGGLKWDELEEEKSVVLNQKLSWGATGPSIAPGAELRFLARESLGIGGMAVTLLRFEQTPCERPEEKLGMEIFTPEGNPESTAVGVQIVGDCRWEIFIEDKDLHTGSLFRTIPLQ